jgi:hypothetical protein
MDSGSRNKVGHAFLVAALSSVVAITACATASPRQRPLDAGPVETGSGSLQATRRQLEGTWTLTRFEVADAAGKLTPVRARAQLTYDGFGNLSIRGNLEEPLPGQTSVGEEPVLAYTGKALIDTAKQEMVLTGTEASVEPSPELLAKIGLESRRKYAFNDGTLTISVMDAAGAITSRATFRRSS